VFVQTEAKSLIQLYPEQQARMKEFADLSLSLSLSLSLCLSLYQYRQAPAELLCEHC
jgi:hypothetical protein